MDDAIRTALGRGQLIEMTTTGARTGNARRIDIVLHNFDQRLYLSGVPNSTRKRGWLANLEAHPDFTIRLREGPAFELPARARVISDPAERKAVLAKVAAVWNRTDVDTMVEHSPLVEVSVEGYPV
jgi:deazaflavin-dependent oxidoreductase (nitroreductase family)